MMKKYLGNKYSENHIINYINYWMDSYEKPRAENDIDCLYFAGDLRADTIFSVWTPLKFVLDNLNPHERFYKTNRYDNQNPHKFLLKIKADIDRFLPKDNKMVQELYRFAELAEKRVNYIKWPKQGINGQRYDDDFDQIPPALYKCFPDSPDNKYCSYFNNDEIELLKWIRDEKLEPLFKNGSVKKENIKPLISIMKPYESKWLKDENEILEMLQNYNSILEERLKHFIV